MPLLMIESLAAFCRHCPLLSWLLDLHTHIHTLARTCTHLDIPQRSEYCFQSNFCRCSDPWNGAKSLSSPQRYVKAADCLIQAPILTLWPPLNTLASLPQYPWLSQKQAFSTANNSGMHAGWCLCADFEVWERIVLPGVHAALGVCVCAPF